MKKYLDIETGAILTADELRKEFNTKSDEDRAEYDYNFNAWIANCLNSTLERI